jgi:hypothetical protein
MAYPNNPRILSCGDKGIPHIVNIYEANSQSFLVGQLVYDSGASANGAATVVPSDGTSILGIAQTAATNVTSAHETIDVEVIKPGDRVAIRCYDTSDTAVKAASNFLKGKSYGLVLASNLYYIDFDETTADACVFIEPLDTVNYPYWAIVQFLPAVLQHTGIGV